jgi:hypothetical protein
LSSAIYRVNPASPSLQLVATFTPGVVFPEGPSFSGSDDLYVNTRGTGSQAVGGGSGAQGVWVVPGVANPSTIVPVTPLPVFTSSSIGSFGEGTTFAATGHLLVVDESGNRVLSAKARPGPFPNFGAFAPVTPLITTNLSSPVDIAVNTCGDVLVASGTAIQRFSVTKDLSTGNLSAVFQNPYVDFRHSDVVTFMKRDASNTLWVATNSSSAGGKIWKILPVLNAAGDPISSCTSGILPSSPLVSLKDLSQGAAALLTSSQTQAVGLAITAASFTQTVCVQASGAIGSCTFSPANQSNTYNFGHYTLTVSYKQVFTMFAQSFTSIMSRPQDVTFAPASFQAGTAGLRFPSLGGFVVQFHTAPGPPGPTAGTNFAATDATGPAVKLVLEFHDPVEGFRHPGLAHASDSTNCPGGSGALPCSYSDDITHDFWVLLDQADGGDIPCWCSNYVPFDEPFVGTLALPLTVTLNEPALTGNPLFNLGQNFTVSISVTDANGHAVNGLTIRLSAARISPTPIALQTVQATNTSTEQNLMNNNSSGKYSIGVDTGLFTGGTGTYQFTIFGEGFPPFVFTVQFTK